MFPRSPVRVIRKNVISRRYDRVACEPALGIVRLLPFLVEDALMSLGATFSKVKDWGVHTVADGQLITGQNPASSGPAARLLIDTLNKKAK